MTAIAAPQTLARLATPPDDRPHLTARPVLHMGDVLLMGAIRSEQAAGFSNDRTKIDDARQTLWWQTNKERLDAWLFDDVDGNTVGYGLLRQAEDGRWYSSVAVRKAHTGKSYGRTITSWLVTQWPYEVWASARNDNPAAQLLHDKLIWEVLGADSDLTYYRTRPKVRPALRAMSLDYCEWLGQ